MKAKLITELIKSLSKSEKRYFKVNSAIIKTNKNLIQLFNVLEKNELVSDMELIKQLGLKNKNNLSVIENRLHNLILTHLKNFHGNNSQSIELNNIIIQIEILYNKRLYKNCQKLILKGKKIAKHTDNHLALLSILKWESFIEKEEGKYLHQSQEKLNDILTYENKVIEDYKNLTQAKFHTFNILLLSKNRAIAQLNKELISYDQKVKKDEFKVSKNDAFDIKLYKLNFLAMYNMSKGDYTKCLDLYYDLVSLIEESDRKNILISNEYFLALNNQLLMLVMNKELKGYEDTLKKIYHQFSNIDAYQPLLFNITQCYELGVYCELADIKKGIKILPIIENNLKTYAEDTNDISKLLFYLNIGIMNYFNSNYSESINWLNHFLNDLSIKKSKVNSNIYYYAHIINLVVHFDAKNYDSINYLHRESINNLKKIRSLNSFDTTILGFIKSYSEKQLAERKKTEAFQKLKTELLEIIKNPEEATALHFFDFIAWTDSHIKNTPIHKIIQSKN